MLETKSKVCGTYTNAVFRKTNLGNKLPRKYNINKIGYDTKAAARQNPNCIKKTKKYGEKRFSIWRMEFLHPAMWHVALG